MFVKRVSLTSWEKFWSSFSVLREALGRFLFLHLPDVSILRFPPVSFPSLFFLFFLIFTRYVVRSSMCIYKVFVLLLLLISIVNEKIRKM